MLKFAPYILKSLWRHRTRTLLTVTGTAVALFLFSFVQSIGNGLDRLTSDAANDRTLIVFQANRFCPSTSRLPDDYAMRIARLPGVKEAVPIKVFMNNCRASLDVVVFHGLPAEKLRSIRDLELVSGQWEQFEKQRDAALVGSAIAQRRNLHVGQKFSIGALTVTVAGIFNSTEPADESFIFTHLEFLQRTPGLSSVGTSTQIEVWLAPDANVDAVAGNIDSMFHGGPIVTDTRPQGVFQANAVSDLTELIGSTRYLGYACVGLVLLLISTTTVMGVQDRIREHAVLQTIGFSGAKIFCFIVAESLIVSVIGGLIGVSGALAILSASGMAVGTEGVMIPFQPSFDMVISGLWISLTIGFLAALVPAFQAARADIVPALRYA